MGLDMTLYKEHYVCNYDYMKEEQKHFITIMKGSELRTDIKPDRISHITEELMYWRKFNALHDWVINKCANGVDECQKIYIDLDQLKELYSTLVMVQEDHDKAPTLLPTKSGFFFGGTDYDEYYFQEVDRSIKALENIIIEEDTNRTKNKRYADFYYQASW